MNLSKENMRRISDLVESGSTITLEDIKDLQGHNEHLTLLLEARGRLMLGAEIERDQLKSDIEALRKITTELRRWASCEHIHHDTRDYHEHDEPCKVLARIDAILNKEG